MSTWPVHASIEGPIVMIGLGSIGRGTLPLIERHIDFDRSRFTVVAADDRNRALLDERGIDFCQAALSPQNYRDVLTPLLGTGGGFCINLSVDTSSLDIMRLCRELGVPCIDTVVEPWPGFYFNAEADAEMRTNHALRETVRAEKRASPG
ncbi:MAG: saccharopine dehydrogenase NADP-binding domain-containing protein, partial [Alphaproteobacteria bacterium]